MSANAAATPIDELLSGIPAGERRSLAEAFLRRSMPLLRRMVENAPPRMLMESLSAPTDVGALSRLLSGAATDAGVAALDPLADAFARGAEIREELLREAGGTWNVSRVAAHLRVSRQAVDKRRRRGTLLAVEVGDQFHYPVCQFDPTGVVPKLPEVLQAIESESPWTKLSLLLSRTPAGEGMRILEALKAGKVEDALHAARSWGEHGAR